MVNKQQNGDFSGCFYFQSPVWHLLRLILLLKWAKAAKIGHFVAWSRHTVFENCWWQKLNGNIIITPNHGSKQWFVLVDNSWTLQIGSCQSWYRFRSQLHIGHHNNAGRFGHRGILAIKLHQTVPRRAKRLTTSFCQWPSEQCHSLSWGLRQKQQCELESLEFPIGRNHHLSLLSLTLYDNEWTPTADPGTVDSWIHVWSVHAVWRTGGTTWGRSQPVSGLDDDFLGPTGEWCAMALPFALDPEDRSQPLRMWIWVNIN